MGVVNFEFYSTVYMGRDADEASFPVLCARASDIIGAATHWIDEAAVNQLPAPVQTLYKKAICAQVDFLALNGLETLNDTESGGYTVGRVSVHGRQTGTTGGRLSGSISPLAVAYLEQTGLLNPQVPTPEWWW